MKSLVYAVGLLAVLCGCDSKPNQQIQKTETSSKEELNIVGGDVVDSENFTSTGKIGNCTVTRVGPRHFLTAAHCTKDINFLTLTSHKNGKSHPFSISENSVNDLQIRNINNTFSELTNNGVPDNQSLSKADWALITLDMSGSPEQVIEKRKFVKTNFDTRKLGNPKKLDRNSTVMVAGWGNSVDENDVIGKCEYGRCVSDYLTADSSDLRFAYFDIDKLGKASSTGAFLMVSKAMLVKNKIDANRTEYIFENSTNLEDVRGLLAPGDSGGPVLNGNTEIVGVVQGNLEGLASPYRFWNVFSTFNKETVQQTIDLPAIDSMPDSAAEDTTFLIMGYKLSGLAITLSSGESLVPQSDCTGVAEQTLADMQKAKYVQGEDYICLKAPVGSQNKKISFSFNGKLLSQSIWVDAPGCPKGREEEVRTFNVMADYTYPSGYEGTPTHVFSSYISFMGINVKTYASMHPYMSEPWWYYFPAGNTRNLHMKSADAMGLDKINRVLLVSEFYDAKSIVWQEQKREWAPLPPIIPNFEISSAGKSLEVDTGKFIAAQAPGVDYDLDITSVYKAAQRAGIDRNFPEYYRPLVQLNIKNGFQDPLLLGRASLGVRVFGCLKEP